MVSDLSNIFKDELSNTLEQLLSKSSQIDLVNKVDLNNYELTQFIEIAVKFEFKDIVSTNYFYIPNNTATQFEYLMLGGMGDLKEEIDDEITDAVNEIVSNICGSFCTAVNAQNFEDIEQIKAEVKSANIIEGSSILTKENVFEFLINLGDNKLAILILFEEVFAPFLSSITGVTKKHEESDNKNSSKEKEIVNKKNNVTDENLPKNLELLYKIKLKLSVRLGTKVVLLKDILRWDIGEIIELEQMVNEPLEILVNGVKIGEGEAVIVEGKFGLKVKKIGNNLDFNKIGL